VINGHKSAARTDSPDGGTDIATLVRRVMAEVCTVPVICTVSVLLHIVYYWKHTIQRFNLEDLLNSKNESTCSESWTVRIAIRIRGLNIRRTINNCCVLQCSKEDATLPLKIAPSHGGSGPPS